MSDCAARFPRVAAGDLPLMDPAQADHLAGFAKALSDPIRIQVLHLLEQTADLCTCEFETLLNLPQSKVSYHMKVLLDAGLVVRYTRGTWSHYSLARPGVLAQLRTMYSLS